MIMIEMTLIAPLCNVVFIMMSFFSKVSSIGFHPFKIYFTNGAKLAL